MEPAGSRVAAGPARTGLVILAALLAELVVIGAACNQWVAVRIGDQLQHSLVNGGSATARDFKATLLVFNWRLAPQRGDTQHVWLAQVFMIMTLLVLTAALVSLVATGPATFGRTFFGIWTSVLFATVIACYVRGLVNEANTSSSPRVTQALFESLGPTTVAVMAGLLLGLVCAVVGGIVAVQTRRPAPADAAPAARERPYVPPEQPPPFFGESVVRPWPEHQYGTSARNSAAAPSQPAAPPTAPATRPPDVDQPTTRLGAPSQGDQPTVRFPRPPDDDDLGHV